MSSRLASNCDALYVGFLTGHGGDAVQMLHLADGMHRRGARVRIVVPLTDTSIVFADQCAALGIECERTNLIRSDQSGPRQSLRSMIRLARSLRAPIVHFHTGNSCLPRAAMLALELTRAPRAFATIQSPYETIEPTSVRAKFWAFAARRRLHAVVSPSEHGSAFQRSCGLDDSQVVTARNAIDTDAIARGDASKARAELGLTPDEQLIVFTSRIDGQKRPVDAVRMLAQVADEFPQASLVFVGTGDQSAEVSRVAAELGVASRVRLLGHRTDVADWLAALTVWVLPTERENFSVAILEALAAGCPVLSTTCPGNTEVLVDNDNSLTFGVGDIDAGSAALRRLLGDPVLRARLSQRGVECARAYTVDHMVDEYIRLYDRFGALPGHLDRDADSTVVRGS
jgi:glycosyltransferase involved in cell wall biosynthesis